MRRATERRRAFGNRVGMFFDCGSHLIKKLVDRDECRATYVPVRLLDLPVEVYRCGEVFVEQFDGFCADVLGKRVVRIMRVKPPKLITTGRPIECLNPTRSTSACDADLMCPKPR